MSKRLLVQNSAAGEPLDWLEKWKTRLAELDRDGDAARQPKLFVDNPPKEDVRVPEAGCVIRFGIQNRFRSPPCVLA